MRVGVLGPIELRDDAGATVRVAGESQRRLLAVLAVHSGASVRAEHLEDVLELSSGALRTAVSRLRRVVGFDAVVTEPTGYELRSVRIDAVEFERLLCTAAAAEGRSRRDALRAAVHLWRGEAYAEFSHERWAIAEVTRLEELRLGAVEAVAEMEIDAGETPSAIARMEALIDAHPYADRPRGLLMEALVRSGRTPEALRSFVEYRRFLATEMGTEPGPDLVELDQRIVTTAGSGIGRALPSRLTGLVGRGDELDAVVALIGRHRLVTVTGAGGCGKTSLAVEAARRIADGNGRRAAWVELDRTRDDGQVADLLLSSCGIVGPTGAAGVAALVRCLSMEDGALLVIDNAEQVRAAVADSVVSLLRWCPDLRVVVTSREPLDVPGEAVWKVRPLSLPASGASTESDLAAAGAGELLLERVREARPSLQMDGDDISAMASICHRLDGLPLALELVAERVRSLPPVRVALELEGSLASLGTRGGGCADHHRTLLASVTWSVELLGVVERVALSRLAVFDGSFDEDDAASVISDGDPIDRASAIAALARLVDANLVDLDPGSRRYRLPEVTRAFCRESNAPHPLPGLGGVHDDHREAVHEVDRRVQPVGVLR